MLLEDREGNALRESICHVIQPGDLVELKHPVIHQLSHTVDPGIDVPAPLAVDGVVRHHDARGVVLPHP
eukprot:423590-Rhodomonas_salina.1